GAIVGAISGTQKQTISKFIGITYWDVELRKKVTVSFLVKQDTTKFINRAKSDLIEIPDDMKKNNPSLEDDVEQNQKQVKGCAIAIGIFVAIVIILIAIIESN
ncbi:MAG: hypothetical protein IKT35_01475, partial [Clostridia bacterium]|nr:hypothetical protein [Clostridia bacterium]